MHNPVSSLAPYNEFLRLQKLYSYGIVDTNSENPFDRITRLAAQLLEAPMAQLVFVDSEHTFVKSNIGTLDSNDMVREENLCEPAIETGQTILLNNIQEQPEFSDHPFIIENNINFYIGAPLKSPEGFAIGVLSVLDTHPKGVSEQQQATLETLANVVMDILEMRLATRQAMHAQTDMMNKAVHDLKNPNTTISLSAELIKKKADDIEIVHNFADRIKRATHDTLLSIHHLIEVSQVEQGNFRLNMQEIDVLHLLKLIKQDFELRLQKKHLNLKISCNTTTLVLGDPKRLQEAFENLLANAIKYSYPHTEIQINISEADENLLIEFKDEGQGLSESDMGKLFVKFAKLSSTPVDKDYSNGMGLSVARVLIELHKGKIWATSEGKEAGASFYIALPIS